jgi:predicted transcriptional regulator
MPTTVIRKTKVVLSDYPYRKDIENRLSLSSLTLFEVDVLREILHHSLKYPISQLAEILDTTAEELIPVLDKLSATKLFKRDHGNLIIDKEMRKYYEFQIEKFEEDFEPNLEFLQSLLNKVPIHVLPNWYAISRSSDNIFASIIEKFFLTPKEYRVFLSELKFDDPVISKIIKDLYAAPNFKVLAKDLIKKYKLTREKFEEYVLLLEYNFVCCLRYDLVDDQWEECITPFQEWLDYLQFEAHSKPQSIPDSKIKLTCAEEFWFPKDLAILINLCSTKKVKITDIKSTAFYHADNYKNLIEKAIELGFVDKVAVNSLLATDKGLLWLTKTLLQQAHALINQLPTPKGPYWTQKNLRLIEKSLKVLATQEWVYIDDFLQGFHATLGDRDPVSLQKKGKKWKYVLPKYEPEELEFVKTVIMERLFELGLVSTGTLKGKPCFCLTPYGAQHIT